ncbi:MAG TPA: hypothetical protein PKH93_07115, partial [Chitinophagales bacterium]|nr:hypothetical protein [Chitinophagales bacterium]
MQKRLLFILLINCIWFPFPTLLAQIIQNPVFDAPEQDCFQAIPLCSNSYSQEDYFIGFGTDLEVFPFNSCLESGEMNNTWYVFSIKQGGNLGFTINPDGDADFALWDITYIGCSQIAQTPPDRCNYSDANGPTGLTPNNATTGNLSYGNGQPSMMPGLVVQAGHTYALLINVLLPNPFSYDGYTINFNGSAQINNNGGTPPSFDVVGCSTDQPLIAVMGAPVACNSIQASDFSMNGGTITSVVPLECNGNFTTLVQLNYTLSGGTTGVTVSANGLTDLCGNNISGTRPVDFPPDIFLTASATEMCAGSGDQITISSNLVGQWSNGQTSNSITVSPSTTTIYTQTVVNGLCSKSASVTVTVHPAGYAQITPQNAATCSGGSVFLSVNAPAGSQITWSGGSFTGSANDVSIQANPSSASQYTVNILSPDGCPATASTNVYAGAPSPDPACVNLYVTPNGSPSGDGTRLSPVDLPTAIGMATC